MMTRRVFRVAQSIAPLLLAAVILVVGGGILTHRLALATTYGVSMNPVYHEGDLVVVARASTYAVGDIVAYRPPDAQLTLLHRIIGGDASAGFVMKGDNNQSIDRFTPTPNQIVGRAFLHLPHVGDWMHLITSPIALASVALFLILAGGSTARIRRRHLRRKRRATMSRNDIGTHRARTERASSDRARSDRTSADRARSLSAQPRPLQAAATAAGAIGFVGLLLGIVAWSAPQEVTAETSTTITRQLAFGYHADVAPSAAYDGTFVTAPDPVFRALADTVRVDLDYTGNTGTMTVDAALSNPSGWHSTVPLSGPTPVFTAAHQSVQLTLSTLADRAAAAAAVTGASPTPLTVSIQATVVSDAGFKTFTPSVAFELTPIQLTLVGGSGSLTVGDNVKEAAGTVQPASLGVGAVALPVSTARVLSVVLVGLATLLAAGYALLRSRLSPLSEGAQIRRRYAPLIAAVEPMTTPADAAVVEVSEFATLATVARRYGLMIMHWSRSEVDTFLVLDEGATYRYRCGTDSVPVSVATDLQTVDAGPGQPLD